MVRLMNNKRISFSEEVWALRESYEFGKGGKNERIIDEIYSTAANRSMSHVRRWKKIGEIVAKNKEVFDGREKDFIKNLGCLEMAYLDERGKGKEIIGAGIVRRRIVGMESYLESSLENGSVQSDNSFQSNVPLQLNAVHPERVRKWVYSFIGAVAGLVLLCGCSPRSTEVDPLRQRVEEAERA